MKKVLFVFCWFLSALSFCDAQTRSVWNGKPCAVVLTYDDAIPQQLDNALPALDSLHLKATFYLTAYLIAQVDIPKCTGWNNVQSKLAPFKKGTHNLVVVLKSNSTLEVDWVSFE